MSIEDDSPNIVDSQPVISPKPEETSKANNFSFPIDMLINLYEIFILDTVIKSNLSEPGVKKIIKKKVIWADEKNQALVQTSFFEIDDSELSDMHVFARTCAANISIAQLEKVMERDLRKRRGIQDISSNDDDKQVLPPLPALIKILLPDTIQVPQIISQERFVQEEREKTVLQALFIRSFLPDSPGEPDGDLVGHNHIERSEPKLIPLEDVRIKINKNQISRLFHRIIINISLIFVFVFNTELLKNKSLNICICRIMHHLYRVQ